MKVVITGASGFIGHKLALHLQTSGCTAVALTRDVKRATPALPGIHCVQADLEQPGAWCASLDGAEAIVHLAGEPIAGARWDAHQKQLLRDSRVETTRVLVEAIAKCATPPRILVTASGVDYYPFAIDLDEFSDDEVSEADPPGDHFLARLCKSWEAEAFRAEAYGVRVCAMRTGLVLGHSGALSKIAAPFRWYIGGKIGSGRQWMSWIHIDDVVGAYVAALRDDRYRGAINLVAASIRNKDFASALGRSLHRPSWIPVPAFAVRAGIGEFAEILLHGRRVVPKRLQEFGFAYAYPNLDQALAASV